MKLEHLRLFKAAMINVVTVIAKSLIDPLVCLPQGLLRMLTCIHA